MLAKFSNFHANFGHFSVFFHSASDLKSIYFLKNYTLNFWSINRIFYPDSHVYLTLTVPLFRCFLVFIGKYDDDKLNTWSILWEFECEFECEYVCVSGNVSKCVMRYRGLRYLTSWLSPIPANKYTLQNFRWLLLLTTTN